MKCKLIALSRRYVMALRTHLKHGPQASLQPAHELGCQAAALNLETLDGARIHARALATLEISKLKNGVMKRAEIFLPSPSPRSWRRIAPRRPLQTQVLSCFTRVNERMLLNEK